MAYSWFGVVVPVRVIVYFVLYNIMSLIQKYIMIEKAKSMYAMTGRFFCLQGVSMALMLKEVVMARVEKEYIETEVIKTHNIVLERMYRQNIDGIDTEQNKKEILERVSDMKNIKERATDKLEYMQSFIAQQTRVSVMMLDLLKWFRYEVCIVTAVYIGIHMALKIAARRLYIAHRSRRMGHQNTIEWLVHRVQHTRNKEEQSEPSTAHNTAVEAESVHKAEVEQCRAETNAYFARNIGLRLAQDIVFNFYILCTMYYLLCHSERDKIRDFYSISHKFGKVTECIVKVY